MTSTSTKMSMPALIPPIEKELIRAELTPDKLLRKTNKGGNEIYVFHASTAPETMREIGRLREEAFRFYGGGTGKACDVDEFDLAEDGYRQLIVWDPVEGAILGGYRFIFGDEVQVDEATGKPRLATAEMFDFSPTFLRNYLPSTIELGRSFVSLPYQSTRMGAKSLFALDNLWDGLGALTVLNPKMRYFYGKVTMYQDYDAHARNLILYFLGKHFPDPERLVVPTEPLPIEIDEAEVQALFCHEDFRADYKALNQAIRALGLNIPPLVSAYMALSPEMRVFGTAINYEFGFVQETGILIAIEDIIPDKRSRHIETFDEQAAQTELLWTNISRQVRLVKS